MSPLNPTIRLRKTDAGLVAIKERDRSVAPRARTLLIMVDGVKTVAQLVSLYANPSEGMDLLSQLVQSGLLTEVRDAASPAPAVAAAVPPAPVVTSANASVPVKNAGAVPTRDLKASIRAATRFLEGWIGPASEPLCLQLERCKTFAEFETKVQDIKVALASRSASKAEEFAAKALGS
jgi:hypothetical protein